MRRWLTLFLVLVLPLQFSWAAAGIACAHETGSAAHHFGHHVHQHKADAKPAKEKGKAEVSKSMADTDCPYCHVSVPTPVADIPFFEAPQADSATLPEPLSLRALLLEEAPERPNWRQPA